MTEPLIVTLTASDEALRLWTRADRLLSTSDELMALIEAMDLGIRAVEIAIVDRLQDHKDEFPATVAALLGRGNAPIDVHRDAVAPPHTLGFTELLDLISPQESDCVAPGLHRGWEDRRFSCRRARTRAQEILEFSLEPEARRELLVLSAYRNRIFRLPPPVAIDIKELQSSLMALRGLAEVFVND